MDTIKFIKVDESGAETVHVCQMRSVGGALALYRIVNGVESATPLDTSGMDPVARANVLAWAVKNGIVAAGATMFA